MRCGSFQVAVRVAALAIACELGGCGKATVVPALNPNAPVEIVVPARGAYTGAYVDFGETEDGVTLEKIEEFENLAGKHQAIIASSNYWGEQSFPARNVNLIWRYGAVPLVFWSPWDRPYEQKRGPDRFGLHEIINGTWDEYVDKWGDAAREFGKPIFVSFANEMNGDWFPWSGSFYGGNLPVDGRPGEWQGPQAFKAAYRHVVDRVRARGASNVKWVFHTNNYSEPNDTWNYAPAYYPGPEYVDWLGMSVYGQQFSRGPWSALQPLMDWPYEEMSRIDPHKPIMIAEWGAGEFPLSGDKAAWIKEGLEVFLTKYPRVKGAVYWHERWQNANGSYSNLRVSSSVEALQAYRDGVAHPDWLGELILRPLEK